MSWVEAVKAYCAKKGCKYTIPRKGSKEYDEVKAMMGGSAPKAEAPKADEPKEAPDGEGTKKGEVRKTARKAFEGLEKMRSKPAKAKEEDKPVAVAGVVAKAKKGKVEAKEAPRRKRASKKAESATVMSEAAGVHVGKVSRKRVSKAKAIANEIAKSEGVTERAAEHSANPEMLLNNATNVHEPIAPPAALAGDLKELKRDVAKVRKPRALPKLVEPERVVNDAPFSFLEFKRKLGA